MQIRIKRAKFAGACILAAAFALLLLDGAFVSGQNQRNMAQGAEAGTGAEGSGVQAAGGQADGTEPVGAVAAQADGTEPASAAVDSESAGAQDAVAQNRAGAAMQGWLDTTSGDRMYYQDGVYKTGFTKIGKKYYYFDAYGILQTGKVRTQERVYVTNKKGVIQYIKADGKLYYSNGKKMTAADAEDFKVQKRAAKIVRKITNRKMSEEEKIRACFDYVMQFPYKTMRVFDPSDGWPAENANDFFIRKEGDCHADGSAFAYLLAALGYKDVYVCNDSLGENGEGHSWTEFHGKVYDSLFAEAKNFDDYYGVSYVQYGLQPVLHVQIPYSSVSHAKKKAKSLRKEKEGLTFDAGSYYFYEKGKMIQNSWKELDGGRYYFQEDGKAATYSTEIEGKNYIFDTLGRLQTPEEEQIVSIGAKRYLVSPSGEAVSGWNKGHRYYYNQKGERMTGAEVVQTIFLGQKR